MHVQVHFKLSMQFAILLHPICFLGSEKCHMKYVKKKVPSIVYMSFGFSSAWKIDQYTMGRQSRKTKKKHRCDASVLIYMDFFPSPCQQSKTIILIVC
jgi:hypothetical protein